MKKHLTQAALNKQLIQMQTFNLIKTKHGMGQYYSPVNEDKMEQLYSHDYNSGLKLMEHSWLDNNFVKTVENLLAPGQPWHKCKLTWAGDYGKQYDYLSKAKQIKPLESTHSYRYIINHDEKQYVDKHNVKGFRPSWAGSADAEEEWKIHPLPLLTADGNGGGGGDFRGEDPNELVGYWAGDSISVSDIKPEEDWEELIFDLVE